MTTEESGAIHSFQDADPADRNRVKQPRCSVIIPARDEGTTIARCLSALVDGLPDGFSRIIVACNGCRDETATIARRFARPDLRVIELPEGGKARAIRAAERLLSDVPRVYLDADVEFRGSDLVQLVERLAAGTHHLVSPSIHHDCSGCGYGASALSHVWLSLPHARKSGFHHVLGVSTEGRSRWNEFPDVIADDAFIAARFEPGERVIDAETRVIVRPPRTVRAWIGVRARWMRGQRELQSLGLAECPVPGQRTALLRLLRKPSNLPGIALYAVVRIVAAIEATCSSSRRGGWYRDDTSRSVV